MPDRNRICLALALACLFALVASDVALARKTVCTITVNSPDERETFRRHLPGAEYDFVELVERGRPDWLASACRAGVACDVLLISGHFDGGTEFYTDRLDAREFLPVEELERAACGDTCAGLFAHLQEVYLFGCNTLNADAMRSASAEITRSLVRAGHSDADAARVAQVLADRHGESNRERMRHVFKDVPVLYGFSSKAPLGRSAGPSLDRYFQAAGAAEIGSGRPSARLLAQFAASGMTAVAGLTAGDPRAGLRDDVCRFRDPRPSTAARLDFLHDVLGREMAEVRFLLDHIEPYAAAIDGAATDAGAIAARARIAADADARARFLAFARDADDPAVRVRMLALAHSLGWLTDAERAAELVRMFGETLDRDAIGVADVDLACTLGADPAVSAQARAATFGRGATRGIAQSAVLACLGRSEAHASVLTALTSARDDDVALAQVYLRHRPQLAVEESRAVTARVGRMDGAYAQVRALNALAPLRLDDPESLEALVRLYPRARSVDVQRAIAGVLIRSDFRAIATPELASALRRHRLKSSDGADVIDALLRRLPAS